MKWVPDPMLSAESRRMSRITVRCPHCLVVTLGHYRHKRSFRPAEDVVVQTKTVDGARVVLVYCPSCGRAVKLDGWIAVLSNAA